MSGGGLLLSDFALACLLVLVRKVSDTLSFPPFARSRVPSRNNAGPGGGEKNGGTVIRYFSSAAFRPRIALKAMSF